MKDWLLDPEIAYLNHGSYGALPRAVGDAAADLRAMMERDPTDLLARRLPTMLAAVRGQLSELLNTDEAGCVFVLNTTAGVATILGALAPSFEPGDEILATDHRYNGIGVQLGAMDVRRRTNTVFAHVPLDIATAADVVTAITDRITPRTRLLLVDSIASASGFVFPLADIVTAAHERGIPVLVDAAHAAGQIDVDLRAIGADFWVSNLHKWICSPRAAAILSVAPQWRDMIRPLVPSHHYADGFQPAFDWTGTFDPVTLLAVPAALAFWDDLGWDNVRRRQRALVDDGAARVAAALGTTAPVADEFRAAMRVVELPRRLSIEQARQVEATLSGKYQVEVAMMMMQDRNLVRVCAQIYNSPADYDRLAAALPGLLESE